MCVDTLDWDPLPCGVVEEQSSDLKVFADVLCCHILLCAIDKICQEVLLISCLVRTHVNDALCKGVYWSMVELAVLLLIHAYSFSAILLVLQLKGCTLCLEEKVIRGVARDAASLFL